MIDDAHDNAFMMHMPRMSMLNTRGVIALLANKVEFKRTQKGQAAFEVLKKKLTTTPVLILPDVRKTFSVYCYASYTSVNPKNKL
jgi:hypothetical protein